MYRFWVAREFFLRSLKNGIHCYLRFERFCTHSRPTTVIVVFVFFLVFFLMFFSSGSFVSSSGVYPTGSWLGESVKALLGDGTKLKYIVYTRSLGKKPRFLVVFVLYLSVKKKHELVGYILSQPSSWTLLGRVIYSFSVVPINFAQWPNKSVLRSWTRRQPLSNI